MRPDIDVRVSALLDPKQPPKAATIPEITALVISIETLKGAEQLAQMRRDNDIHSELHFLTVGLVGLLKKTKAPGAPNVASKLSLVKWSCTLLC